MYDVLFAPSREEYGDEVASDIECVFCSIRDEDPQVWTREIYRDGTSIVIMNVYPYSPGHIQVLPRRHLETPADLSEDELFHSSAIIQRGIELTDEALDPDGWNVGLNIGEAGASISHLHFQIVPRYEDEREEDQEEIHEMLLENKE
ncbi:MAG: HIT family protein, partial [Candidatus Aenigmatarchaeota archaeon]